MIIELFGLPGSGKTTLARALEKEGKATRVRIVSRWELIRYNLIFIAKHPVRSVVLLGYVVRYAGSLPLFHTKFMNLILHHNAKYEKAHSLSGRIVIDQGHFQNLLSLFEQAMSAPMLARYVSWLPCPDELWICAMPQSERVARLHSRGYGGASEERVLGAVITNYETVVPILSSDTRLRVRSISTDTAIEELLP
ncbi:AAA family ATPase [Candidatus Parcubacteria bacterium]|nr:AAA family ATPase [Candidatus Parcubacteria bacterium]